MEAHLNRISDDGTATMGTLAIGPIVVDTLELPYKSNAIGISCIKQGRYQVVINFSNRFQRPMPEIIGVPERTGIRIHCGNTAANTEGCVLIAEKAAGDTLIGSKLAFDLVYPLIEKYWRAPEGLWISVLNSDDDTADAIPAPTS